MSGMSYRDKMIVLILSIIIILVAGFFALIRPKYQALVADTATYETTKADADDVQRRLDEIPKLEDTIKTDHADAKKTAQLFVNDAFVKDGAAQDETMDVDKINYLLDKYLRESLTASTLKVEAMSIGEASTQNVEYYYYTPNILTYSLLEAGDINSNYAANVEEAIKAGTVVETKESVDLMYNSVVLNVSGERENLMLLLDAIKDMDDAVLVNSVNIEDYTFTGGLNAEAGTTTQTRMVPQLDEEGNPVLDEEGNEVMIEETVEVAAGAAAAGTGYSNMEVVIGFYNAKEIDEPDFTVGTADTASESELG